MVMDMSRRPLKDTGADIFGEHLRELRKSRGWTQAKLAESVGIERAMVGNYELGLHYPPIPTLIKLADALEISVDRLLGREENQTADIQDRRLYQLFVDADRTDLATQGVIKQVVESLLITGRGSRIRTGTKG